jgi:PST family polysaccharide transporter
MGLKKAAIINAMGKYSVIVIQLFVTAILSRILSAEDYGVIAIVTVFTTFFSTLANMGFGTAIVQIKELKNEEVNDIFSFTFYASSALSIIFSLFSFVIAWFYNDNLYIPVSVLLSISLFFSTLNMVPNGILNRDKKFTTIAIRNIIVYCVIAVIEILLAKLGFKYYAIVIGGIISAFFSFIWNYLTTGVKFKFKFNVESIKKVLNYSGFQFASNFVNYFANNLDNLLTGKLFGAAELGYYSKAYSLILYPVNNLTGVISPVIHPILSDYQNNKEVMYKKYMQIVKLLSLIGIYVEAVCFFCSDEIVTIMFGSNWSSTAECFKLLSVCILFRMINSASAGIFQALGNTKLLFENGLLNTIITVIAILVGVFAFGNIVGLALCVGIAYVIHYLTASWMLIRMGFELRMKDYYRELKFEVLIFFILGIASLIFNITVESVIISLCIKVFYLTLIYIVLLVITKEFKVYTSLLFKRRK